MAPRRWKLGLLVVAALAVGCLGLGLWLSRPENLVRREHHDNVRLGMTPQEAEIVVGLRAGYTDRTELPIDDHGDRVLAWYGDRHALFVWLDDDGRVAHKAFVPEWWDDESLVNRITNWIWQWLG